MTMASFTSLPSRLRSLPNLLWKTPNFLTFQMQQMRTKYADARQYKDQRRRFCVKQHALERLRLNSIYRCSFLPQEIRDVALKDVCQLPRNSNYIRLRNRCYVTSRPRGLIQEFRVSRIIFRQLADYNNLSGVQRAEW